LGLRCVLACFSIVPNVPNRPSTERIADPSMIAALLSFDLSTRNKLAAWVPTVPKDPFLHPHEFLYGFSSWVHSQNPANNGSTQMLPATNMLAQSGGSNVGFGSGNTSSNASPAPPFTPVMTPSAMTSPLMGSDEQRRHTFRDLSSVQRVRLLRTEWMRINVEL
jgi:hypothetical protein